MQIQDDDVGGFALVQESRHTLRQREAVVGGGDDLASAGAGHNRRGCGCLRLWMGLRGVQRTSSLIEKSAPKAKEMSTSETRRAK